jgi:LmbE family N-acetylglucosaminyl deacetylase
LSTSLQKAVLVLAPHPDDESFGCGGTIRMLVESGVAVDVVFMTRGELGLEEGACASAQARRELAEVRSREARAACDVLGVRQVEFLNGADTQLRDQPQLAAVLADLIRRQPYQRVFCPWPEDGHDDHMATFSLLCQAVIQLDGGPAPPQFWLYEVWRPLAANTFVPIDGTMEVKRRAIEQYQSQLKQLNYHEGFLGLAAYRSLFCPSTKYAEAFLVCDRDEIRSAGINQGRQASNPP